MELYDKKFVYFEWDDKLEGKEVILARTIKNLKEFVSSGDKDRFFVVQKGNDLPFSNGTVDCGFCYYDPYYEFRKAYIEGKQLQFKNHKGDWEDVIGAPVFTIDEYRIFTGDEYRIKPKENKNVPFDTVQELIDTWDEKYPQNKNRPEGTMPLIWIKTKQKNRVYLITGFYFDKLYGNNDVCCSGNSYTLRELFENCTFIDGSVIGKKD